MLIKDHFGNNMIKFTKYRKAYYALSLTLIGVAIFSLINFGMNLGIEFTGGSIIEIEYESDRPTTEELKRTLSGLDLGELTIQPAGDNSFVIRMKDISDDTYLELRDRLSEARVNYFESIGPAIGSELRNNAIISIILASLAIIIYIAMTFTGIEGGSIKSWQYGVVAAGIGFFHDVLIVIGVFSLLGYLYGVQFTIPIAVALLTVLGYTINDTVVIFDRIRENLALDPRANFEKIVDKSINNTLGRSINTSLTTLFVLFAIFFLGGETLKYFIMALILGISLGTYSSIFLAGPLLVSWLKLKEKKINQ